jgi:hypothetical protein
VPELTASLALDVPPVVVVVPVPVVVVVPVPVGVVVVCRDEMSMARFVVLLLVLPDPLAVEVVGDVVLPEDVEAPVEAVTDEPEDDEVDDSATGVEPGGVVVNPMLNGLLIDAGVAPIPLVALDEAFASRE